jgi:hypothetical protein
LDKKPLKERPLDMFLIFWFSIFCISSFIFEQYIIFGVDLSGTADIFGRTWYWYAKAFDPIFLDSPLWLRIMCTIDGYIFGACYPFFIYALLNSRNWIRIPALMYGSAIIYATLLYFGWEFLDQRNQESANLTAVFIINIPYTIVPLILMWRVRHPEPFSPRAKVTMR